MMQVHFLDEDAIIDHVISGISESLVNANASRSFNVQVSQECDAKARDWEGARLVMQTDTATGCVSTNRNVRFGRMYVYMASSVVDSPSDANALSSTKGESSCPSSQDPHGPPGSDSGVNEYVRQTQSHPTRGRGIEEEKGQRWFCDRSSHQLRRGHSGCRNQPTRRSSRRYRRERGLVTQRQETPRRRGQGLFSWLVPDERVCRLS